MASFTHEEFEKLEIPTEAKPEICFFCSQNIKGSSNDTGGLVYWSGNDDKQIALHQSCAILLSVKLIQDSRTLMSKTNEEIKITEGQKRDISNLAFHKI